MPFSTDQTKALSSKLNGKVVRTRSDNGRELSYLEAWYVISEANRIFGYDGWDRETIDARCVWDGAHRGQRACSYTARVRVRVRADNLSIVREASGAGCGLGPTQAEAHEIAIKTAETDAMKRALATFGNPFGLALYDKDQQGVRHPRRELSRPLSFGIRHTDGHMLSTHDRPQEFCSALRSYLEGIAERDELVRAWTANLETVKSLRQVVPALRSERGQHYADILEGLYVRRVKEFQEAQPVSSIICERTPSSSTILLPKPRRVRDPEHRRSVAAQPCLVCGRKPSHPHHVRFAQPRALARKVSDEWVVPLCATHHRSLHDVGNEQEWWALQGINPIEAAEKLWMATRHPDMGSGQVVPSAEEFRSDGTICPPNHSADG